MGCADDIEVRRNFHIRFLRRDIIKYLTRQSSAQPVTVIHYIKHPMNEKVSINLESSHFLLRTRISSETHLNELELSCARSYGEASYFAGELEAFRAGSAF
jgi:hypothetical protein